MKITWKSTFYNQIGFHAELHEYDGQPPVLSLLMDHAPKNMNLEREAMAAYLAFGHWTSGDLQLPHRLGPNTAGAIERDMKHVAVRPSPVEYYPKPLALGLRQIDVGFDGRNISHTAPSLTVLPSSEWNGAMRGLQSIAVASNAFVFDAAASHSFESVRGRLAVAVLFAEDLSADSFFVKTEAPLPAVEQSRLTELLLSVRLGVEFGII